MKAIVVTDEAAGTAGMTLVERPEPEPAINDVVVRVHASGFTSGELTWPSTWADRLGRDQTPGRGRPLGPSNGCRKGAAWNEPSGSASRPGNRAAMPANRAAPPGRLSMSLRQCS
jgi:hypothetical protein